MKGWNWLKEECQAEKEGRQDERVEYCCGGRVFVGFVVDAKFLMMTRITVIDDLIGPLWREIKPGC